MSMSQSAQSVYNTVSKWAEFNVPFDTKQLISESLFSQPSVLVKITQLDHEKIKKYQIHKNAKK